MSLEVFTINQAAEWDKIVKSFRNYDVYWLSGYVKAFQIHGDGKPLLFYHRDNNTRGINVVMQRNIDFYKSDNGEKYYDFATPYGYGGWLIEGDNPELLFEEYEKWNKANNVVSEFVRFHPLIKNHEKCKDIYDVIQLGEVVHMNIENKAKIWDNITSKNRNMIRKAQKNNIHIKTAKNTEIFQTFKKIYNETMDKDNADPYYYFSDFFYKSIEIDLSKNSTVFYAEKDEKIIAASIILNANGRLNYHLSGSIRDYSTFAPTNLLLYEVAVWGQKNKYKTLFLGGGVGSTEDGLLKFKKSFNKGALNHFYIGKKIWNKEVYEEICKTVNANNGSSFFPSYRENIK